MIIGEDRATQAARQAVAHALQNGASGAFALLRASDESLTRYSNSAIENSTRSFEPSIYLRVTVGKRLASTSSSNLDDASIGAQAALAVDLAHKSPEMKKIPELAGPVASYPRVDGYDPATAEMPAEGRADLVRRAVSRLKGITGTKVYGNVVTGTDETAIANSNGVEAYFAGSVARLQVTSIAASRGAGIARHAGRSMAGADPEALADASIQKASRFSAFGDVPPGDYEVVLEPPAAGETLFHLGYLGFGGYGHLQGNSCFAGQIGQQVLSPRVTLWDDPLHSGTMCEPFDGEGTPRQRLSLVQEGIICGAVYDLETAVKAGAASTGHGLGPEGSWFSEGPFPRHLVLKPGTSSRDEMISHVEHGLLITSFHYTRPLDPRRAVITGMTRNGTFLIRDGKISAMLPNLRFAVSAITLLTNVREVGSDATLAGDYVCHMTPSVRTIGFSVTGKTEG